MTSQRRRGGRLKGTVTLASVTHNAAGYRVG
jgi:hypothetical protein